ncbi:MAG: tagaturonate reductase [Cytophagales bacterium]|nr:tagaturonate reductase [Cytophagales bacterium]
MTQLHRNTHAPYPLPSEKVLQFGTGILLRGLPDFFIDQANRQGLFNGSVVVVKSTAGRADEFARQDNLYTTLVRGVQGGKTVEEDFVNGCISRVVSANDQWAEVLRTAADPNVQVVISNTTEVGLQYVPESVLQTPPASFPAKLAGWLYERYRTLGRQAPATVVIPTELIPDNGPLLRGFVLQLAAHNQLETSFLDWLETHVLFCSSLVDRIVTNASAEAAGALPYTDPLAIQTEPYRLWAIEGNAAVREILSFAAADAGVIVADDIAYYRERKLRLLNGTHTISVCLAFLKGFDTVYQMMQDAEMAAFVRQVMMDEIAPSVPVGDAADLRIFAEEVLDRFANPNIVHRLINITLQATSKMKMRNVPTMRRFYEKFAKTPACMARGFAAYVLFTKPVRQENGVFYGERNGTAYPIQDDAAAYFHAAWQRHGDDYAVLATEVCGQADLWGHDLTQLPGFVDSVVAEMNRLPNQKIDSVTV